jgi:hypothetical protein
MWSEEIDYTRARISRKLMWKPYYDHYLKIIVKCM